MRTGIATVPLDTGRCPYWLFEKIKKLSRGIVLAIIEEFGPEEILKRLSDPVWFQSLGCVMGFDWNSSGLTTTTLGALKEGIRGIESKIGFFICVGPRTIRALSLVAEVIYGAKPSYEDPARYSFAHGGKDHTPFPVDRKTYNKTIEVIERGIKKSDISIKEKSEAQKRLLNNFNL